MGLIRAAVGAVGGTMADQWREFFYCEAMDADTLVVKGQKQVGRSIFVRIISALSFKSIFCWTV